MSANSSTDENDPLASASTGHDHLTALPLELLNSVSSYLWPDHDPDLAFHPERRLLPCCHSLDYLAATSRHMRAAVNAWAQSYLLQHATLTGFQQAINITDTKQSDNAPESNSFDQANRLRGVSGLLTLSTTRCVFCGDDSSCRKAIFANGICCCAACDDIFWPDKVTKTAARSQFALKESDLFPKTGSGIAGGRVATPGLQHGTYVSRGSPATVFLKNELQALADGLHGIGWEVERSEKAIRRRSKRDVRLNIEHDMAHKQIELLYSRSNDFDGWAPGDDEDLLCDAPEGWSDLSQVVKRRLLGELPGDWMKEQDERWERQWRKEQDFERRILEQDAAIDLELFSNEPPGWFEMTIAERYNLFVISKLDLDARISKQEQEAECELFGNEPPGWFEMTPVEREELFVFKEVVWN
ncbi:uncharacterized protein MYCGRDRAFT_93894 [Zymoseptoria tritici IPO323]|uniref:Uncharacterized protein n=1 Tax=Zymoseptoria tritici (strain CBS 115943 / IPO323) TaxID=336722 RepID=F9XDD7_ZYMTI|nr:uncharacterized protein MYCGRDRAFT_93894 [Zymoseptoria tritici IPO323]EGP86820.1 hypothetical protein MYCGRDRAFT_93894 [Zymoseptoria tritici IPO323]